MGAPTWPPTPEEARKAVLEEYGEDARAVLDDEEAERLLLAPFLFAEPRGMLGGAEAGTPLEPLLRSLEAWLAMLVGRPVKVAPSDPPTTDGAVIFLPPAAPAPAREAEDRLFFRVAALVQLGLVESGLLANRALVAEMHTDWVLRSCVHLLALHHLRERWARAWPGLARDFQAVAALDKATELRVNLSPVPRRGMPGDFVPLYDGLVDFLDPAGPEGDLAREAVAAVRAASDPRAAPLVVLGQARKLRIAFRERRLGPPPLPRFAGLIRPEWLLHDLAAEMKASRAWRDEDPGPLRLLGKKLRRRLPARRAPVPEPEALTGEPLPPPPEDDAASFRYPEWDAAAGSWRLDAVRVREVEAPRGPAGAWERAVEAHRGAIALVRRRFASLRVEERWLHRQVDGSDLDLDRAVAAMGELAAGFTPREDWTMRFVREREAVAILVMVDLSGSTRGEIARLERDAVVVLSHGLLVLGHPHAIYGFSNEGPEDCRFARLRGWDEPYDEAARRRLGTFRSGGSTRLGAFVRHGARVLLRRPESRRVMLVLSDGRPHDRAGYTGRQALADSALAVLDARRRGIHVHCVSIDAHERAREALDAVFGPGRYLHLKRVDELPVKLAEALVHLVR